MKKIRCTFYRPEQVNVREFHSIVEKLSEDFHTACSKEVDADSLRIYANDLLDCAKPLAKKPKMFFLGLDEPGNMPSDARVDFFYMPTYLGTAMVIRAALECLTFMDELETDPEKKNAFHGMLLGCTGRGFKGHGFDDLKGMIETLGVFAQARTEEFIRKYPDICREFTQLYKRSIAELEKKRAEGKVRNEWGEDYSREAEAVIRMYKNNS